MLRQCGVTDTESVSEHCEVEFIDRSQKTADTKSHRLVDKFVESPLS